MIWEDTFKDSQVLKCYDSTSHKYSQNSVLGQQGDWKTRHFEKKKVKTVFHHCKLTRLAANRCHWTTAFSCFKNTSLPLLFSSLIGLEKLVI